VAEGQLAELGLLDLGGAQPLPGAKEQQDLIGSLSWVSRIGIDDGEQASIAEAVEDAQALASAVNSAADDGEPLFSVVPVANHTRNGTESHRSPLAEKGEIFRNAPAEKGGYFKVASILE
jgi:aspartyl-tRNA synthetase